MNEQEAMATFQKYIDNNVNQTEGHVTFHNIKELLDKNVKFFVTVNGWFSTYEAEIDLVFDDIASQFVWKYKGAMAIWHGVEIKKYSSHIYINNEVIYYKP